MQVNGLPLPDPLPDLCLWAAGRASTNVLQMKRGTIGRPALIDGRHQGRSEPFAVLMALDLLLWFGSAASPPRSNIVTFWPSPFVINVIRDDDDDDITTTLVTYV